jgi:hypothetical protein
VAEAANKVVLVVGSDKCEMVREAIGLLGEQIDW